MTKHMKSFIYALFICLLIATNEVSAGENQYMDEAEYLNEIGLFKGTNNGYELDDSGNRLHAAVMVVRLLGKEEEALAINNNHPFTDVPDWASAYVGYLYSNGITAGISETYFGGNESVTASQYMTFLLRVSGYDDSVGDFRWNESLEKAKALNVLSENEYLAYEKDSILDRGDMVFMTYKVLMCEMKVSNISLLKYLINNEVVDERSVYDYTLVGLTNTEYIATPQTMEELKENIKKALYNFEPSISIDMSQLRIDDISAIMNESIEELIDVPGLGSCLKMWNASYNYWEFNIEFEYLISKADYNTALEKGEEVMAQLITEEMHDFEKELAIHDYIINNTRYDEGDIIDNNAYTIFGVFNDNIAVCQGYADAFHYMANLAGIEGCVVVGVAEGQPHAWNIIEIDGEAYQVDVTFDDPIMSDGSDQLQYSYFNITDVMMANNHTWEYDDYQSCISTGYNYFEYYHLIVYSKSELKDRIKETVENNEGGLLVYAKDFTVDNSLINDILGRVNGYDNAYYYVIEDTGEINIKFDY